MPYIQQVLQHINYLHIILPLTTHEHDLKPICTSCAESIANMVTRNTQISTEGIPESVDAPQKKHLMGTASSSDCTFHYHTKPGIAHDHSNVIVPPEPCILGSDPAFRP